MRLKYPLVVSAEPLTLLEAAQQCRLADTQAEVDALPDKDLLASIITTARETVENYTERAVAVNSFELFGEVLPAEVKLPRPPFIEVVKVEYWNGTEQVVLPASEYEAEIGSEPAWLYINLPADMVAKRNSARITYKAGYAPIIEGAVETPTVPASLKAAMKLLVEHYYNNREAVMIGTTSTIGTTMPLGVEYQMNFYRVYS
ncbi:putative phiE125 gp8 family phage protein [Pontibacter ummariensis]|uniref:Phage gp6-like head-tail connector protein n=1 Tax=Pontibacter ummariensis TaxID=1610492 RepID=A0A239HK69_9BACT|nr:phage head-tail connector protein [Pontibacter ummariensis]PRY10288.1 putative phiE125 gp8 family phage protein [Pontibacter ummariensis]SNS81468.1 phage conserved hypothetical protein, phiE125 gp8 family [Pontibacter ummariensis]